VREYNCDRDRKPERRKENETMHVKRSTTTSTILFVGVPAAVTLDAAGDTMILWRRVTP
jgi:hypothetical protein